jgi:hypothetical protein
MMASLSSQLISFVRERIPAGELRCSAVRYWLPGYLDGALPDGRRGTRLRVRMASHLDRCAGCRAELKGYQALSRIMMGAEVESPSQDLPVAIRVAVERARETSRFGALVRSWQHRFELLLDHVIEPLLVPASGGALVALLVFAFVFPNLGGGLLPLRGAAADLPISLMQPARLQTLAGFPMPALPILNDLSGRSDSQGLLLEATVNADGQAVNYRIIGAPLDAGTQRALDHVVLFSRFRPQLNFGRPASSGRVVLGFSQIFVRG